MKFVRFTSLFLFLYIPFNLAAQQTLPVAQDSLSSRSSNRSVRGINPPALKSFIIPAVFIGYGFVALNNNTLRKLDISTRDEIQEDHPLFANHLDNYLRFVPAAAFYGLNLAGVK